MSKSKSRLLADLIGASGHVKADKMDTAAKADMSNVGTLPASVKAQLKGDIGNTGAKGTTGSQGIQGITGNTGPAGSNGTIGVDGATGATGATGSQGVKGDTGAAGATGSQGVAGTPGSAGAQGAKGDTGDTGATGSQGATGSAGSNGTNGTDGAAGAQGIQGIKGNTGSPGAAGSNGTNGTNGTNGSTGATGPQGSADTNAQVLAKIKAVDGSGSGLDADLLDGQQGSSYLRSNADDTISGNIGWANGKSFYINGSGGGRVPYPAGASYFTTTGTVTGAIKIKLPTASKGTSDMISFEVSIFDYSNNESVKLLINAYQYSSINWTNHTVVILTGSSSKDYTVRFGSDSTSHCLWIAETGSTWSHPQVSVSNFTCGYSASAANYVDGWLVAFVTAFDTVQDYVTTNLPIPQIANDSINSQHYAAGSIDNEHIADNAINSEHYADNSIDALHLNVSGNGTTSQWLRSDGDGTMSWVAPPSNYAATSHTHAYLPLSGGAMTGNITRFNTASSTWPYNFKTSAVGNDNDSGFWVSSVGYPDMRLRKDSGTVRALISSWERSYTTYGLTDATDMRAPLFYDTDNTAYYFNPASTSVFNAIQKSGQPTPRYDTSFNVAQSQHWYGHTGSQVMYLGESGNPVRARGTLNIGSDANAQTGYKLSVHGSTHFNNYDANYLNQVHFQDNVRFYDDGNDSHLNFKYGDSSSGGLKFRDGSGTVRGHVYSDTSAMGILAADGSWVFRGTNSDSRMYAGSNALRLEAGNELNFYTGDSTPATLYINHHAAASVVNINNSRFIVNTDHSVSSQSSRAPIFYDSNNTSYYTNPASTSALNVLTVAGTLSVNGNTTLGNASGDKVHINDIVHIGATDSGDADLYFGEGSLHNIRYGVHWNWDSGHGFKWYTRLNGADTTLLSYETDDTSHVKIHRSLRVPSVYDFDNTAYYADMNGTSVFNILHIHGEIYNDGWFRNDTSGKGLYNTATGQHFYSDHDDYWNVAGGTTANGIRFRDDHAGSTRGAVYADSSNNVGILNNGLNWRMRIVGGDYGIFEGSSVRAQIFYDSNNTAYYTNPASTSVMSWVQVNGGITAGSWEIMKESNNDYIHYFEGNTRLTLTSSGNLTASGSLTAYSDERLKTNVETIPSALEKVNALRGVTFDMNGVRGLGVIAQETEAVIPEVVITADDEMGTKSVAYGNMVGLLIEAIKEQQVQIDELKELIKCQ